VDLAGLKSAQPRLRYWPGTTSPLGVLPLSSQQIDAAEFAARQPFDLRGIEPKGHRFAILQHAEILARALVDPETGAALGTAGEILAMTDDAGIVALTELWLKVQAESVEGGRKLEAEIELQFREKGPALADAAGIVTSKSPADFFGVAGHDITDGQISYWIAIRNVHHDQFERESDGWNGGKTTKALEKRAGRSARIKARRERSQR
jgi:hypothetical protein